MLRGNTTGVAHGPRRLSRRVYALFIGCTVVPLALWAALGWHRVTTALEERAYDHLRDELHAYGNGVVDRLTTIEGDLALVAARLALGGPANAVALPVHLPDRVRSLAMISEGEVTLLHGEAPPAAATDAASSDPGLRCVTPAVGDRARVCASYRGASASFHLVAEIDPNYLWNLVAYADVEAISVADEDSRLLDPRANPIPEEARRSDRTVFPWFVDGEEYIATSRLLFVKPQFGVNFRIVSGLPRERILAPAVQLARVLVMSGVIALLSATLLGRRLIRRVLGPVETLRRATNQVADGDLEARVTVETDDELAELAASFNGMTQELKATNARLVAARDAAVSAMRVQGEFIQNVSHELRTPITGVLAATEILGQMRPGDFEAQNEFIAVALGQSRHLKELVDDIIGYTEVRAEREQVPAQRVDLVESVGAAVERASRRARLDGQRLIVGAAPLSQPVMGSELRLGELWDRLLDNALKFGPAGGEVSIRVGSDGDGAFVEVEDQGPGIAEADREAVFEPFRQSSHDLTTDKPPGTGLGLAISHEIVTRHQGRIAVISGKGSGATVRVTLPASGAPSEASVAL